jgi:asparagine synthase (glutamine-hydrolysing)
MCGIAGVVLRRGVVPPDWLLTLSDSLRHRGPDSVGYLGWDGSGSPSASTSADEAAARVALVHRRLSIIDLTSAGWQPMLTADGATAIVYNGEVYNYLELRTELESLGHEFKSHSDTEVLLRGWEAWGDDVFGRLVGMFAVAILDSRRRRVVLARDFAGIKPLYLARWGDGLAFASDIQSLLQLPPVSTKADAQSVLDYLAHEIVDHGERTFFRDVSALPPATIMELDADTGAVLDTRRFWTPPSEVVRDVSFAEAVERTRELFVRSVELHLRSDVPVGVALSGGVDSSSIAGAVRSIGGGGVDLRTYSYIPTGHALSEERWIADVVTATGARSTYVHPSAEDLAHELPAMVAVQGEPVGGPSVFAQYHVFRAARADGVIVMLDGQGADELLAGYKPMSVSALAALLRRGRVRDAWRLAQGVAGGASQARVLLAQAVRRLAAARVPASVVRRSVPNWLDIGALQQLGAADESASWRGHQTLTAELHDYFSRRSLPHLLRYEDRNSMAWSLESRVPFLTPELATWFLSLPPEHQLAADGTSKAVLRSAMRGIVPDSVLDRRDKLGFEVPTADWLVGEPDWARRTLDDAHDLVRGINVPEARRSYDQMVAGERPVDPAVWRWLNIATWARTFEVAW